MINYFEAKKQQKEALKDVLYFMLMFSILVILSFSFQVTFQCTSPAVLIFEPKGRSCLGDLM